MVNVRFIAFSIIEIDLQKVNFLLQMYNLKLFAKNVTYVFTFKQAIWLFFKSVMTGTSFSFKFFLAQVFEID